MTRRKGIGALLLLVLSLFIAPPTRGQETAVPEEQLKAAFIYNFARFVEWPTNAFSNDSAPLVLGVLGDEEFASKLNSLLKDKKAHNRSFVVRKLGSPSDASTCQIVFVARGDARKTPQAIEAAHGKATLFVGESDDFLANGGMINIVQDEKKKQLSFDINPQAAEKVNLTISSHLLRLARNAKKGAE
jgi:hypothetical protein